MKKFILTFLVGSFLFLAPLAYADSWGTLGTIENVYVTPGGVNFHAPNIDGTTDCSLYSNVGIERTDPMFQAKLSVVLGAYLTGRKVKVSYESGNCTDDGYLRAKTIVLTDSE